jgi:site-specific recombinase XerD
MQTSEHVLSMLAENLKQRGLATITQKQYLRFAREFLEWSGRNLSELDGDDIAHYLTYLANPRRLDASTINVRNVAIRRLFNAVTGAEKFCSEPRRILVKNGCLRDCREAFSRYLLDLGYSKKSLRNYRWTIRCIDQFMVENSLHEYSRSVGERFLDEAAKSGRHTPGIVEMMGYVVRRFDCFREQGEYILILPRISRECPPQFAEGLANYLDWLRVCGLRESTIEQHRYNIHKALINFDAIGLKSFSELNAESIYAAFEKTSGKVNFCSPTRGFLRYLFETGSVEFDYSPFVPSVRKAHPIPSVYSADETKKLLDSVESSAISGKRNNAIILLALRLGMRSGDIANLKISDIDFQGKTISFIQEKTQMPQRLELLPEVEDALLLYFSTARQNSDIPNVFLSVKSPVRAATAKMIYSLVRHRFDESGIDTRERKRGGHALRMTLASELVAEKVPYDAVRKILGHEDPVSIKHYVKFDIEALRSCAIGVPSPTGKLAAYIEARLGG